MSNIDRPKRMGDIRSAQPTARPTVQAVSKPALKVEEPEFCPSPENPYHIGDCVSLRFTKGMVTQVKGDGIEVDFGLGMKWLNYKEVKLVAPLPLTE